MFAGGSAPRAAHGFLNKAQLLDTQLPTRTLDAECGTSSDHYELE